MGIQKQSTPSLSLVLANAHETLLNMDSLYSLPKYIAFWSKSNFTKFDSVYMEEYTNIYKIESLLLLEPSFFLENAEDIYVSFHWKGTSWFTSS